MKLAKIMRGVPGSGKSTHARKMRNDFLNEAPFRRSVIFSSDAKLHVDGVYTWTYERMKKAHDDVLLDFVKDVSDGLAVNTLLIVDNTNTTAWEISPYYRLAEAYGWNVEIIQVNCPARTAAARTVHGVPLDKVLAMESRINVETLPPWWKVTHVDGEK